MPLIKIELPKGKDKNTLLKIRDLVMDSVAESLLLPTDDRNIRILEYDSELFLMKNPYEILIEITMFQGRTTETKKKIFQNLVNKLESGKVYKKEQIYIILNEQPLENWGVRGGIQASEIKFDFNIKI